MSKKIKYQKQVQKIAWLWTGVEVTTKACDLSPTQPRLQHERKDDCTIDFTQKM